MYKRKEVLQDIINKHPEACLVKNKYKALGHMADIMYPQLNAINKKIITDIVYDIVNGDRDWRKLTEGMDKENKVRLEQEYIIKNYG